MWPLNWIPKEQSLSLQEELLKSEGDDRQNTQLLEKRARQKQSALVKLRAANNYRRMFEDAALRIVRRERANISDKAKRAFSERNESEFLAWLETVL